MAEEIRKDVEEEKRDNIPIDAKLLSDAVIELNISRRSVGLYPREHPITRESIERAFGFLEKLFELRSSITLGIAKDTLIIDDNILDRRNPVFRDFALSLHSKGVAAVSFRNGVTMEELLGLHEILVSKDPIAGQAVKELSEKNGLKHIILTPLDITKFGFAEGRHREDDGDIEIWENYVSGLIEGRLADGDAEGFILNVPPEDIALFMNERVKGDARDDTYDKVITSYLRRKESPGIRTELFNKFLLMVNNLSPELKMQFLRRAFNHPSVDTGEAERLLGGLTSDDIEKMMSIFRENPSLIPDSVRNLLDKLRSTKTEGGFFDMLSQTRALVDDIEIDGNVLQLFEGDHFKAFVSEDYRQELERMLKGTRAKAAGAVKGLRESCSDEAIEKRFSELLLELIEVDTLSRDDYLGFLSGISRMATDFLETGRFSEVSEIYNAVYSHGITGRYRDEARSMIDYFFRSGSFIDDFMRAIRLWGRHNREGVFRLANVQKVHLIDRILDTLAVETAASVRKFLLQLLSDMGRDVAVEALKRLDDNRWYVVRNMIYLLREAGGPEYVRQVRNFARDKNKKICTEAVKTLLHFKTRDASSYLKLYLQGDDVELRDQAVRLAGMYRCKDTTTLLLDMLRKRDIFGTESYYRISVVKALGEMGDPAAINDLLKLYNSRTLFYGSALEELKVEIFMSLQNYPAGSIVSLIKAGLDSKNDEIRSLCEKLLQNGGGTDVAGKNI